MKRFATMEKHEDHYHCNDSSDYEMYILGRFLASDVSGSAAGFICSLLDEKLTGVDGNLTQLDKNDDLVIMSDIYSEQDDGGPYLEFKKNDIIEILKEWDKHFKQKMQKIYIEQENNKITFT